MSKHLFELLSMTGRRHISLPVFVFEDESPDDAFERTAREYGIVDGCRWVRAKPPAE